SNSSNFAKSARDRAAVGGRDATVRSWTSGRKSPISGDDNSARSRRTCPESSSADAGGEELPMSKEQLSQLDGILRQGRFDTAADVASVRAAFNAFVSQVPVPTDVLQKPIELGGVGGIEVTIAGNETDNVMLYFHSGVYVIGSAAATVPLVGELVRRTGVRAVTLDYR